MAFKLRSREARFREQFALIAARLVDGAQVLAESLGTDDEGRRLLAARMQDIDQAASAATRAVLRSLAAAFVTPFDRVDVYRLAWAMRTCSARMESVADLMALFELGTLPVGMSDQVNEVSRAAELTCHVMPRLGRTNVMSEAWSELALVRAQAREAHHRLLVELTATPMEATRLARLLAVAQGLDDSVRAYEGVAHVLEQIVVKES